MGQTWSEGRRGGTGGAGGARGEQVEEQERGGSVSTWPVAPLDITLPLELSKKPVNSPAETVSDVGGDNPEGELFQSIRGLHEVKEHQIHQLQDDDDYRAVWRR